MGVQSRKSEVGNEVPTYDSRFTTQVIWIHDFRLTVTELLAEYCPLQE